MLVVYLEIKAVISPKKNKIKAPPQRFILIEFISPKRCLENKQNIQFNLTYE